ncbi:TIGR01777 family oxidoreductase [bacterium]|nr:TIGR01777 family oxidoreductase [candidate division CSSED10-310 bacterium]
MDILISGASGYIGSHIASRLAAREHRIRSLTRKPAASHDIAWNPSRGSIQSEDLKCIHAVIHLAGENIGSGLWTREKRERILESRLQGTRLIARTCAALNPPPRVLLSASAVGFYGDRGDALLDEREPPGDGFLAEVCAAWEQAAQPAAQAGIRLVQMRFGLVLSPDGGFFRKMTGPIRWGFGTVIGSGNQYMSWISMLDLVRAVRFLLDSETISGPVNLTTPGPVTNREFTRMTADSLNRPVLFRLPAFLPRMVSKTMADNLLLSSIRALPYRLLEADFTFSDPDLKTFLIHCKSNQSG